VLIPRSALAVLAGRLGSSPQGLQEASLELEVDPLDLVRGGAAGFGSAFFYSSPGGDSFGGLGVAWTASETGPGRFAELDRRLGEAPWGIEALVGFSFSPDGPASSRWDGFPAATAVVPRIGVWRRGGASRLRVAVPPGVIPSAVLGAAAVLHPPEPPGGLPGGRVLEAIPPAGEWVSRVGEAVNEIRAGIIDKVVLARSVRVDLGGPVDPFDLVALMVDRFPGCHVYGWQAGSSVLVGASPELLVRRRGACFETRPLAGSAPRSADPGEDARLGEALLASVKDRAEHAFVVNEIVARLGTLVTGMKRPLGPGLERLAGVQHLATALTGSTGSRLLELAGAIHPTPAVAGVPRDQALAHIHGAEGIDRGWYSGGVGLASPGGDGELAVVLRCALVQGETAILFVGNGIVADSEPEAELEETEVKLAPFLQLLGVS
jgi:isochorismate synthase